MLDWLVFQRFSAALEAFDIKLATTSPTHAFIKTGLRDRSSDRFSEYSPTEIASAETKSLKSTGHASEVCSVLTAYRLLDVMYALEHPDDAIKAPEHHRLRVNFASFKVIISFSSLMPSYSPWYLFRFPSNSQIGRQLPRAFTGYSATKRLWVIHPLLSRITALVDFTPCTIYTITSRSTGHCLACNSQPLM